MKRDRISNPGIISRIEITPIQLKKIRQKAIPAKSRTSPNIGDDMNGTRKSNRSKVRHTASVDRSSHVNRDDHGASIV